MESLGEGGGMCHTESLSTSLTLLKLHEWFERKIG